MPAPLHEDARIYLRNQGRPITSANLNEAMETLRNDSSLRPSYSSDNQMASNLGYSEEPDNTKYPMSPLRPNSEAKGDRYFTADSQFGSDPTANSNRAKANQLEAKRMADADRRSGTMFKGGKGATPGTTASSTKGATPGTTKLSVSTENEASTGASVPPVQTARLGGDVDYNNQLARPRPRPAAAGAGMGGREQQVANAPVPTPRPPASPGTTAAQPAAVQGPTPSVPVPPNTGALPAPVGAPRLQPTTPPDWPGSTRWTGPSVTMPIPGAGPAPTMLAGPSGINPAAAASPLVPSATMPLPPPPGGFPPPAPTAQSPFMESLTNPGNPFPISPQDIGNLLTPRAPEEAGQAQAARAQAAQTMAPRMGGDPGPVAPLVPPDIAAIPGQVRSWAQPGTDRLMTDLNNQFQNPHIPAVPPQVQDGISALLAAIPTPQSMNAAQAGVGRAGTARLPPTPGKGMTLEDARASQGGGVPQPEGQPQKPPRRGSLRRGRARENQK